MMHVFNDIVCNVKDRAGSFRFPPTYANLKLVSNWNIYVIF